MVISIFPGVLESQDTKLALERSDLRSVNGAASTLASKWICVSKRTAIHQYAATEIATSITARAEISDCLVDSGVLNQTKGFPKIVGTSNTSKWNELRIDSNISLHSARFLLLSGMFGLVSLALVAKNGEAASNRIAPELPQSNRRHKKGLAENS